MPAKQALNQVVCVTTAHHVLQPEVRRVLCLYSSGSSVAVHLDDLGQACNIGKP